MRKTVQTGDVEFHKVDWGLTKNLVGPGSVAFVPAGVPHATTNLSDSESLTAIIIKSPPGDEEVRM